MPNGQFPLQRRPNSPQFVPLDKPLHRLQQLPLFFPDMRGEHPGERPKLGSIQPTFFRAREILAHTYVLVAEFFHQRDQFWKPPRHRKQYVFLSRKVAANLLFILLLHFQLPSIKVDHIFLQRTFDLHTQSQSVLVLA